MFVLASNHFRQYFSVNASVWLRMKNKFFGKYFQLTVCFNSFDPEIGFSQNFHFKPFLNSCAKRERERERESPDHAFSEDHAFDFADLRIDLRTHESIIDPEPSTHKPWTSSATQSLCAMSPRTDLSVWFWFFVWFWLTHELIYVFVILNFYSLFDLWFFFIVVVVVWVVVFWWFSCCVVVGFVWVVVENSIFKILPNTWKYFLEQFS